MEEGRMGKRWGGEWEDWIQKGGRFSDNGGCQILALFLHPNLWCGSMWTYASEFVWVGLSRPLCVAKTCLQVKEQTFSSQNRFPSPCRGYIGSHVGWIGMSVFDGSQVTCDTESLFGLLSLKQKANARKIHVLDHSHHTWGKEIEPFSLAQWSQLKFPPSH